MGRCKRVSSDTRRRSKTPEHSASLAGRQSAFRKLLRHSRFRCSSIRGMDTRRNPLGWAICWASSTSARCEHEGRARARARCTSTSTIPTTNNQLCRRRRTKSFLLQVGYGVRCAIVQFARTVIQGWNLCRATASSTACWPRSRTFAVVLATLLLAAAVACRRWTKLQPRRARKAGRSARGVRRGTDASLKQKQQELAEQRQRTGANAFGCRGEPAASAADSNRRSELELVKSCELVCAQHREELRARPNWKTRRSRSIGAA